MTSKERVQAALGGQPVDRVPTGPLAVHFCAALAGYNLRQYSTEARALAESVLRYYEMFQPDAVWLSADTWVSAEAMGAEVGAVDDHQPFGGLGGPTLRSAGDLDRIPAPDVGCQGRYPLMLEALSRIRKGLGNDVFVVGCFDQYPFSLAAALLGMQQCMLKLADDSPFVQAVMERGAEFALAYARALSDAGADMLSGGDSPAVMIGRGNYKHLVLPAEKFLIARIKAATGKPVSLHICGDTTSLLPLMAQSGADVLEIDHAVPLGKACEIVGPEIGLWGNLDPLALLAPATPAQVARAAQDAATEVRSRGHKRFVLSSGCTLAVDTPHENLRAMLRPIAP